MANRALYYVRFLLRPVSEQLIGQGIDGGIARAYTVGRYPDDVLVPVKYFLTESGDWEIDLLEVIQKITIHAFDENEHDSELISELASRIDEEGLVVFDIEEWFLV